MEFAFADALKKAASEVFHAPLVHFYADDKKEVVDDYWGMSPRNMLQKLGTEACREIFGQDVWIKSLVKKLSDYDTFDIVVTDVRFENEAAMVRERGGVVIHVISDRETTLETSTQAHASEAGVALHDEDYQIFNNGTLADLSLSALSVYAMIKDLK